MERLGISLVIPKLSVEVIISYKALKEKEAELWINLAISFLMGAKSYWMICEFRRQEEIKHYA